MINTVSTAASHEFMPNPKPTDNQDMSCYCVGTESAKRLTNYANQPFSSSEIGQPGSAHLNNSVFIQGLVEDVL